MMFRELGAGLKIVLFAIASAIFYGISHDQFTARISVEYFTLGHEKLIESESPTVLAFLWGTIATWWVGLSLGIPLAVACRVGNRPKLEWRDLVRPMAVLLGCMAVCALVAGVTGYVMARTGRVEPYFSESLGRADVAVRFLAVNWTHIASYLSGAIGGMVLICWAWRMRYVRSQSNSEN